MPINYKLCVALYYLHKHGFAEVASVDSFDYNLFCTYNHLPRHLELVHHQLP